MCLREHEWLRIPSKLVIIMFLTSGRFPETRSFGFGGGGGEAQECHNEVHLRAPCRQDQLSPNSTHGDSIWQQYGPWLPSSFDFPKRPTRHPLLACVPPASYRVFDVYFKRPVAV